MDNNSKFADDISKFYDSPVWPILKHRLNQYRDRLDGDISMAIRKADMHKANRLDAKKECIDEIILIINGLAVEVKKGKINLNQALENGRKIIYDN